MDPFSTDTCTRLRDLLFQQKKKIVFAESCTAGLIAASMARFPGISEFLAGSAVVYQLETKSTWLSVSEQDLEDPGPVSQAVSEQMATGVLNKTPHADVAASVTGHLGPGAPPQLDGGAWTTVAIAGVGKVATTSRRLQLDVPDDTHNDDIRAIRQILAVRQVVEFCAAALS